jgi:signal peptidase I
MERLHNAAAASGLFAVRELPDAVQPTVLHGWVELRVVSSSMKPTLHIGDRVQLGPADDLRSGDLIVFRHGSAWICHRLLHLVGSCLSTKGDAVEGPPERIARADVVGRVTAILRGGRRLAVPPEPPAHCSGGAVDLQAYWDDCRAKIIHGLVRSLAGLLRQPIIGGALRRLMVPFIVVDVLELAPLRSLESHVRRGRFRLAHIDRLRRALASDAVELERVRLIVRTGPLHLAAGTLAPWTFQARRIAEPLHLADALIQLQAPPQDSSSCPPKRA